MPVATTNNRNRLSNATYDSAGNITQEYGAGYSYDAEGRLVSGSGSAYTYDGMGEAGGPGLTNHISGCPMSRF